MALTIHDYQMLRENNIEENNCKLRNLRLPMLTSTKSKRLGDPIYVTHFHDLLLLAYVFFSVFSFILPRIVSHIEIQGYKGTNAKLKVHTITFCTRRMWLRSKNLTNRLALARDTNAQTRGAHNCTKATTMHLDNALNSITKWPIKTLKATPDE